MYESRDDGTFTQNARPTTDGAAMDAMDGEGQLFLIDMLEKTCVFAPVEIRHLATRLRYFNEKLRYRRSTAAAWTVCAYIRYVQYFDALYQHRTRKAGMKANNLFKTVVFNILRNAIRQFPYDLKLWLAFFNYASRHSARKLVSFGLATSLRLNTSIAGLWAYAARWEFSKEANPFSARTVIQRGLRCCVETQELWREYFDLELKYLRFIRSRSIGLRSVAAEVSNNIDALTVEEGALAASVYNAAKSQHKKDFDFLVQFLTRISELSDVSKTLKNYILKDLFREFPSRRAHLVFLTSDSSSIERAFRDTCSDLPDQYHNKKFWGAVGNVTKSSSALFAECLRYMSILSFIYCFSMQHLHRSTAEIHEIWLGHSMSKDKERKKKCPSILRHNAPRFLEDMERDFLTNTAYFSLRTLLTR